LYQQGATILATTHYSEIKTFAANHDGFINGCMEFDINTLKPLYQLKIGKAGESNGFLIALRLGMRTDLIERAHEITYRETKNYQHMKQQLEEMPKIKTEDTKAKGEISFLEKEKHKDCSML